MTKRILIFEDNIPLATTLVQELSNHDILCEHQENGVSAMKIIQEFSPDIILLDLRMPEVDGWTVLRQIMEHVITVPIMVLTNYENDLDTNTDLLVPVKEIVIKANHSLKTIVDTIMQSLDSEL